MERTTAGLPPLQQPTANSAKAGFRQRLRRLLKAVLQAALLPCGDTRPGACDAAQHPGDGACRGCRQQRRNPLATHDRPLRPQGTLALEADGLQAAAPDAAGGPANR